MTVRAEDISFIIITWQTGRDRLARCLDGLAAQTVQGFRTVVFDNGSTDDTFEALAGRNGVELIRSGTNYGFAGGVNEAARQVEGPWLVFLNPDTVAEPDWLAAMLAAAARWPEDRLFCSVQVEAGDPALLDGLGDVYHATGIVWRGGYGGPVSQAPTEDREVFAASGAAMMVARELFEALGGLAAEFFCYMEDVDFGFRYRLRGGRTILVAAARIAHEGSATTGQYSDFTIYHGTRNRFSVFVRCMPGWSMWALLPAHLFVSGLLYFRALGHRRGGAYLRGLRDGLAAMPTLLRQRREIMAGRRVPAGRILKVMSWSPLALLGRKADMRQPETDFTAD